MGKLQKMLRRIPKKDLPRIRDVLQQIYAKKFVELDRKKLVGYEHIYRIRVGNYRIVYFDDGENIWLKAIQKRDESTYKHLK